MINLRAHPKKRTMRAKSLMFWLLLWPLLAGAADTTLLKQQWQQAGFEKLRLFNTNKPRYEAAAELFINQPLDHENPTGERFMQRVFVRHRGFDRPTVMVTEGYAAGYAQWADYEEEIAEALDANLVVVEHRFFGKSMPDSLAWSQLNLKNATADLHAVNQALRSIYPKAWVSTGISKGGQTTIYYRYFYPDDVAASVPYVAPLNFSVADKRVYHFKDTVATPACRAAVEALQTDLLQRRALFLPMFADSTASRKLTFNRVGGVEKAFEYNVLEFGFAYWQWYSGSCETLPKPGSDPKAVFSAFVDAAGYDFFADQSIAYFQPFFYQALTEMGFYSYETKAFKNLLELVKQPSFNHTLPDGVKVRYSPRLSRKVNKWLRKEGNNFVYVYGGYDAWSATAVQPGNRTNALKLVLPGGSHVTRLANFDEETRQKAIRTLKSWIGEE